MKKKNKIIVSDPLKGIASIYKVYGSAEIELYYIDLNSSLKRCSPDDIMATESHFEIVWLDPQWNAKKTAVKTKFTKVKIPNPFGKPDKCTYLTQTSRYSCWIAFFKDDLLRKAVKSGPVWWQEKKK